MGSLCEAKIHRLPALVASWVTSGRRKQVDEDPPASPLAAPLWAVEQTALVHSLPTFS